MKNILIGILVVLFGISVTSCNRERENIVVSRVIDSANVLTVDQETRLYWLIEELEKNVGSQIAVLTVSSIGQKPIKQYSLSIAEKLKLGSNNNDGLLITIVIKDRKTRIEVGVGLEKIIKDEIANDIIKEEMIPEFKGNRYYEGINSALERIKNLIESNKNLIGRKP